MRRRGKPGPVGRAGGREKQRKMALTQDRGPMGRDGWCRFCGARFDSLALHQEDT